MPDQPVFQSSGALRFIYCQRPAEVVETFDFIGRERAVVDADVVDATLKKSISPLRCIASGTGILASETDKICDISNRTSLRGRRGDETYTISVEIYDTSIIDADYVMPPNIIGWERV